MAAEYTREEVQGFAALTIRGRVGTGDLPLLEAQLLDLRAVAEDGAILDLLDCPYLTSRAFPLILECATALREGGQELYVAANRDVHEILVVLRLESKMQVFAGREEAITAARATRGLGRR